MLDEKKAKNKAVTQRNGKGQWAILKARTPEVTIHDGDQRTLPSDVWLYLETDLDRELVRLAVGRRRCEAIIWPPGVDPRKFPEG